MVQHISARVGVMYLGKLMEVAPSAALYVNPLHPYTQALLSAIPIPDPDESERKQRIILQGDVPTPIDPPPGCPFASRCRFVGEVCRREAPELLNRGGEHFVACHMVD
jgi:oligopeptide transport system ATP-binding protein